MSEENGQPPAAADANQVDLSPIPLLESIRNEDKTTLSLRID